MATIFVLPAGAVFGGGGDAEVDAFLRVSALDRAAMTPTLQRSCANPMRSMLHCRRVCQNASRLKQILCNRVSGSLIRR